MSGTGEDGNLRLIARTFALIELLCDGGRSISELSLMSGLPKGTIHRILQKLVALGYVRQELNGNYALTTKLLEVGHHALYSLDIQKVARPHLEQLARETKETVLLGILEEGYSVLLDQVHAPRDRSVAVMVRLASRTPAHSTSIGKVLMAYLPEETLARLLAMMPLTPVTNHTITSENELKRQLDKVRVDGYAINNEENYEGIVAIAAPIMDYNGDAVAAVNVAVPSFRLGPERTPQLIELVKHAAREISQGLRGIGRPIVLPRTAS